MEDKKTSRFLSLVLRHKPEEINLSLNEEGWANVNELIDKMNQNGFNINQKLLDQIVETNNKKRFTFSDDKKQIRANQGHSIKSIDLKLIAVEPPEFLYHGTVSRFIPAIKDEGLKKMKRQHVHLSKDISTAEIVGGRRGEAILLKVKSKAMYDDGYEFYKSKNNVWLTDHVLSNYIIFND